MNSKKIKYAKEVCFNAKLMDDAEWLRKNLTYEYLVQADDLFIYSKDEEKQAVRLGITKNVDSVIVELSLYRGNSLLRVDEIINETVQFTLLQFADVKEFTQDDSLNIVIDQAATTSLRNSHIDLDKAVETIKKQVIIEDQYALGFGNLAMNRIEIIGDRYAFELEESAQGYLHVVGMRETKYISNIESQVVLLKGCIFITDQLTDKTILTKLANEQYHSLVKNNSEFIKLWDLYDETELESIRQDAAQMSCLEYRSYRRDGDNLVFDIVGLVDSSFLVDGMSYAVIKKKGFDPAKPLEYNPRMAIVVGSEVDKSSNGASSFIIKDEVDLTKTVPSSGYIVPSLQGSLIQSKRRRIARDRVLKGECEMPGLKNIIQAGSRVGISEKHRQAASADLEKLILPPGKHFTELQKKAIDAAINTPDIAIIQGPPGTGKTTVIRAIVARIDELQKGKAKILISSTQHDAVDNAAKDVMYGGVPANRVAHRKSENEEVVSMYGWIDNLIHSCEEWLKKNDETNQRSVVREIFEILNLIEGASSWEEKYNELNKAYMLCIKIITNHELMNFFTKVLSEINNLSQMGEESELSLLLQQQRTEIISFLDDGVDMLKKLERYLKFESDVEYEIPSYWAELKLMNLEDKQLSKLLNQYKKDLDVLDRIANGDVVTSDVNLINSDLVKLIQGIRLELVSLGNDRKQNVADLIWGFKQSLTNPLSVKELIEGYSKVNAATCQQAVNKYLSPSMHGWEEEYDYVIIDEAARSNPLDILIPMSLGKKVILVGDHKQLPHILEPDVVKAVEKKTAMKEAEEILKESLFMRLYNNVSEVDRKSKQPPRACMLKEQYRMHPDICDLVNQFYDGELISACDKKDKEHGLGLYENKALAWLDLQASDTISFEENGKSKCRPCEVDAVKKELTIIRSKNEKASIGVISFYSKQVYLLNKMIQETFPTDAFISVGTVDAFQGKEFDIVILSTVRSNEETESRSRVGFLDNDNRLCVAFSRAKKLLVTIGDSCTVAMNGENVVIKALAELLNRCKKGDGYYESL